MKALQSDLRDLKESKLPCTWLCPPPDPEEPTYYANVAYVLMPVTKEISYEDLKALVGKSQNLLLVDVRSKDQVDKGRIPGSVHIPVDSVEAAFALEPEAFKAKYGVTKPQLDAPEVVFHCNMGGRGARATNTACKLGYVNARNYVGGYKEWSEKEGK